jgi:hypothetical protein
MPNTGIIYKVKLEIKTVLQQFLSFDTPIEKRTIPIPRLDSTNLKNSDYNSSKA